MLNFNSKLVKPKVLHNFRVTQTTFRPTKKFIQKILPFTIKASNIINFALKAHFVKCEALTKDEPSVSKRSHGEPARNFNPIWEESYLFMEHEGYVKCLVCCKILNQFKKFNVQRHYNRYHAKDYGHLTRDERLVEIQQLKVRMLEGDEDLVSEDFNEVTGESHVRASYFIALEIAKSSNSFLESDLIKRCLIIAAEQMCPEEVKNFERIGLSQVTLKKCIEEMAGDVRQQLTSVAQNFITFSLALDESVNISGTPELAIFIRGINRNLEITEELLDICCMNERMSGEDILSCVTKVMERNKLQWKNLVSVATDGTPVMASTKTGFMGLLRVKLDTLSITHTIHAVHCIIHQQNLFCKMVQMDNVMSVVIRTINYIRCHGANHKNLKTLLEEIDTEYNELPYHTEERWFSRGKVLPKFLELREEIAAFMDLAGHSVPELRSFSWIMDLGFLIDILNHLNEFSLNFQGKESTIISLCNAVRAFQMKLYLWTRKLHAGDVSHFKNLQSVSVNNNYENYSNILENLAQEFEVRFKKIIQLENDLKLIDSPFTVDIDTVPSHLQLELIDLMCDPRLERKFQKQTLQGFYNNFDQKKFPQLYSLAANTLSIFGSTYVCEQLFSVLKRTKSADRNRISDDDLKSTLILGTAQAIVPNVNKLIQCKKSQSTEQNMNE